MSDAAAERRAELIAAALADELSSAEHEELERMMRADPGLRAELDEMRDLTGMLSRSVPDWLEEEPSPQLRGCVAGQAAHPEDGAAVVPLRRDAPGGRFRRRGRTVLGAVACAAAGAGLAAGVHALHTAPPSGPPGTLGAVEEVGLAVDPAGVRAEAAVVAHTWGTETVMEIDGLPAQQSYDLVLIAADGTEFDSGSFLGSEVTIECRMNAAVMRPEVARVEVRDDDDVVLWADLPETRET